MTYQIIKNGDGVKIMLVFNDWSEEDAEDVMQAMEDDYNNYLNFLNSFDDFQSLKDKVDNGLILV